MARLSNTQRRRTVASTVAVLVAASFALAVQSGQANAEDPAPLPSVDFITPISGQKAAAGRVHVMLAAAPDVQYVKLTATGAAASTSCLPRQSGSDVFEATVTASIGSLSLQAAAYGDELCQLPLTPADTPATAGVTVVTTGATRFAEPDPDGLDNKTRERLCGPFIRPRVKVVRGTPGTCASAASAVPLGFFKSPLTGLTQTRTTGGTSRAAPHTADAPVFGTSLPAGTGTAPSGGVFRLPVTLTPAQVAARRAVIRVTDGTSSEAVETPLYSQVVTHVRSTTTQVAGGYAIRSTLADQYGQPVVGAPARLTGYVNGSRTPVNQLVATDINGVATFPGVVPANGFYIAIADVDLNGQKASTEPSFETVLGHVAYAAPGRALYHNNTHLKGSSGSYGDTLRGTRAAAAHRYQWIDQNGQLSFSTLANLRRGAARVSSPSQITWVNAHGSPFNPRWLRKGRFESKAWSRIRRNKGLRNADMAFQQNAAHGLSVEWEVKDIRPFARPAALNAAFTSLAASARRYYGPRWQSRVEIKVLSNLSGGQAFAMNVLRAAHAHGFTTMYLARGNATRTQIPAAAHAYVDHVRGARDLLYAYAPPAWQLVDPEPTDPALTAR